GEAREKGLYDDAREYSFADLKGDLDSISALAGAPRLGGGGPGGVGARARGRPALGAGRAAVAARRASRAFFPRQRGNRRRRPACPAHGRKGEGAPGRFSRG